MRRPKDVDLAAGRALDRHRDRGNRREVARLHERQEQRHRSIDDGVARRLAVVAQQELHGAREATDHETVDVVLDVREQPVERVEDDGRAHEL